MIKFSSGPRVVLKIATQEGMIHRTTLELSSFFSCEFIDSPPLKPMIAWLDAYSLHRQIHLPSLFDLSNLSPFQHSVLNQLSQISIGAVRSYSQIAESIGNPRGARAVGNACNRNPFPLFYPCHRVIQKGNKIGGFAIDLEIKRRLLEFEGKTFSSPSE